MKSNIFAARVSKLVFGKTVFAIFKAMPETVAENDLSENLRCISERIAAAAQRANRQPEDVKLIAVSKTYPSRILQTALAAGARRFGENRVQEAETKVADIGRSAAEWHLIGNLQANKARKAARVFDWIHTVDTLEIAERLERICGEEARPAALNVLIQVDLAGEAAKSGAAEKDLPALVEFLANCEHLKLRGLMILPPFFDDAELARPYFKRLREIGEELTAQNVFADSPIELSMGMSNDFEVAIEEGATFVRVGTAIFGKRKPLSKV